MLQQGRARGEHLLAAEAVAEAAQGSVHYCVAAADDSDASGAPVHLLPVRRTRAVPPDRKAFELLPDDDAKPRDLTKRHMSLVEKTQSVLYLRLNWKRSPP